MLTIDTLVLAQDTVFAVKPIMIEAASPDSIYLTKQALKTVFVATNDEPSWTDKTQAIAAVIGGLVAVIGGGLGIWSFIITLKEQDNKISDQQTQIDKLGAIAERLEHQYEFDRIKRRCSIRPYIQLKDSTYNLSGIFIDIINTGDIATNIQFVIPNEVAGVLSPNTPLREEIQRVSCSFYQDQVSFINRQESKSIQCVVHTLMAIEDKVISRKKDFKFDIMYTDRDGNIYTQTVVGKEESHRRLGTLTISDPELVLELLNEKPEIGDEELNEREQNTLNEASI